MEGRGTAARDRHRVRRETERKGDRNARIDEDISLKYLEQLARPLVQAGLLRSVRGKGGGYALAQEPAAIRAGDVLRAVESSTAPVACLDLQEGMACPRAGECTTVRFWAGLDEVIERYVDGVTLADLAGEPGLPSLPAI